MGIEKEVLIDDSGEELGDLLELPNGCLCCTAKDNVVAFIETLVAQKALEFIVIEAHGLTDASDVFK